MRVPTSKLYRAFEELDHLSDEQCEMLVKRISMQPTNKQASWTHAFFGILVVIALTYVIPSVLFSIVKAYPHDNTIFVDILVSVGICVGFLLPFLILLRMRDKQVRRQFYDALHNFLGGIRCSQCDYLLLGQTAEDGYARCPECGKKTSLELLGVTEDDLIPPDNHEARVDA